MSTLQCSLLSTEPRYIRCLVAQTVQTKNRVYGRVVRPCTVQMPWAHTHVRAQWLSLEACDEHQPQTVAQERRAQRCCSLTYNAALAHRACCGHAFHGQKESTSCREHIGREMHVGNQDVKVPVPLRDSDAGDDAARAACRHLSRLRCPQARRCKRKLPASAVSAIAHRGVGSH